ncbi:hypothetical protein WSM22_17550 [Cytophagales bacterium WSM2-2]|nr:hypothetical protein WSM22_17550 [Cytophagales bacterium WSM2-2]
MKTILTLALIFSLIGTLSSQGPKPCNPDGFASECIPKLSTGFNFLKSYKIDGEGGAKDKIEFSYVFTKGTQYMINLCTGETPPDGIVLTMFDSSRNRVITNKVNGQVLTAISYACNATGIYYLQYTFDGSANKCGGSVVGFKRQ